MKLNEFIYFCKKSFNKNFKIKNENIYKHVCLYTKYV